MPTQFMVMKATIKSTEKLQILEINIYVFDYIMLHFLQDFGEKITMGTKDGAWKELRLPG